MVQPNFRWHPKWKPSTPFFSHDSILVTKDNLFSCFFFVCYLGKEKKNKKKFIFIFLFKHRNDHKITVKIQFCVMYLNFYFIISCFITTIIHTWGEYILVYIIVIHKDPNVWLTFTSAMHKPNLLFKISFKI